MFSAGAEKIFTGEAGTVTYLFLIFLVALVCVGWAAARRRCIGTRRLRATGAGFGLLLLSRLLLVSFLAETHAWVELVTIASGIAGFYLLFVSVLATARPGRFELVNREILLFGLLVGSLFGGAFAFGISGKQTGTVSFPMLYSFAAFAPAGFLLGSIRERQRAGACIFLPGISGMFLVASTCLAGLSGLGLMGAAEFWHQLFLLLDVSGFFVLLAAVLLDAPELHAASALTDIEATADSDIHALEWITEVSGKIASGEAIDGVYRGVAEAIKEETGVEFVMVRATKSSDTLLELKSYTGFGELEPDDIFAYSISLDAGLELCKEEREIECGYVLDAADIEWCPGILLPHTVKMDHRKLLLYPVMESGVMRGFFLLGLFDTVPPHVFRILRLYAGQVMQVIQRDRAMEQLRDRERALSVCKEELDSINQLKSNFLSIVSHELRTPLTSIKAYTETILDNITGIGRDTIKDFLRVMDEESERLIKLVDDILNYSCMETGNLKVDKIACNLNEMIEESYQSLEKQFFARKVNSDLRLPRKAVVVDADRELISQLLTHLMSNAVKFTPPGGKVTASLEQEASAARIVIQDTGKGIPEDQLEKIFERFHQVDASDTREHGGSGLGLAICKNIVEWHDGKIWVENVKEAGAKFVVLLPMKDIVVRQTIGSGFVGSIRFERERYLSLLVEMISEFLQAQKASIMQLDKDELLLRVVAAKGLDSEFVQSTRLEVGERIAGRVVETGQSMHVFDIEKDQSIGRANNSLYYGSRSFVSVPLFDEGEVVGVINVSDHVEGREFTAADREILETLGQVVVGMLKKLEAYEKVSSNFEKLKDAMRSILDVREAWGSRNVSNLTLLVLTIGKRLDLDEKSLAALRLGMNLYDLGMMKVPRNIRSKKEELTEQEREKLRRHPNIGYTLISPMGLEERIMRMIKSHHEHYDGSGYPDGLAGAEIPVESRIINVVDTFRALISEGPYRRCYSIDEARNEIIKGSGILFDPKVVGAFVKSLHDLGAREEKCELMFDAVERELEEMRRQTQQIAIQRREEAVKEETTS